MVEAGACSHPKIAASKSSRDAGFSKSPINVLPSSKYIRHAPVVTACITKDQYVSGLRAGRQRDIGCDLIVLHAQAAHQTRLAALDRLKLPAASIAPQNAMRIEKIHRQLGDRTINDYFRRF